MYPCHRSVPWAPDPSFQGALSKRLVPHIYNAMGVSLRPTTFVVVAIVSVAICLYIRSKRSCGDDDGPPTHTSSSSSERLDASPPPRVVPRSSSPVPDTQDGVEVEAEAVANAQEMKAARELRERARRCKREMHVARDRAKSTRRSGDYQAEQRHKHDAMSYESQMKDLDKRAAKVIFKENNKVRGHPSRYQSDARPLSCQAQKEGTVDLHGLYVPEALEYAKKELQSATYRNDDKVCFIVGTSVNEPCIVCDWRLTHWPHSQVEGCIPMVVNRNFGPACKNSVMSTLTPYVRPLPYSLL